MKQLLGTILQKANPDLFLAMEDPLKISILLKLIRLLKVDYELMKANIPKSGKRSKPEQAKGEVIRLEQDNINLKKIVKVLESKVSELTRQVDFLKREILMKEKSYNHVDNEVKSF